MVDMRTLEKRVTTLEESAEAERVASTGIDYHVLRYDELEALCYNLLPARDGERVRAIVRGELYVMFPSLPNLQPCIAKLSEEELQRVAYGDFTPLRAPGARELDTQALSLDALVQWGNFAQELIGELAPDHRPTLGHGFGRSQAI